VPDPLTDERWTLLYDADCGFCKWTVSLLVRWDRRHRLAPRGVQGIEAVALISPAGERHSGGAALPPLLRQLPGGALPARVLARFPRLTERGYAWVAAHRSVLGRIVARRRREP
jgi:predicted DCC family thiol-disulfide oxidoreductase YuxK